METNEPVTMESNDDGVHGDFALREESLMYIDEDPDDLELLQQSSVCRKKCIVRLDNARYTIGSLSVLCLDSCRNFVKYEGLAEWYDSLTLYLTWQFWALPIQQQINI